ncbi:MAG: NADH-quinone oxidoreductase subunit C [Verrucomicrobia bacterium]|jgi:ech hydrogenase subunit D|nr:NADH-quinone oxidoreductase subunit C [Verrucomicrobiota bacterium]
MTEQADTVIEELDRGKLAEEAAKLCGAGYRLVQMMGTPREETIEVMVSFDRAYELKNFRVQVPREDLRLPSISASTLAAFTYENELQDLFGIKVEGLAVDYEGNFLRTRTPHPMAAMADPAVAKKKPAAKGPAAKAEKEGKTVKSVPLSGVKCETAPDIDNPDPDKKS